VNQTNNTNSRRGQFLCRVSLSIFGFLIALIIQNLYGNYYLQLTPFHVEPFKLLITIGLVFLFSIPFMRYWYSEWVNQRRQRWADSSFGKFLVVGFFDCLFAILPYVGYVFALRVIYLVC